MAKIIIAHEAIILKSGLKLEDIKKLERYAPKALVLKDEETKEETFSVATGSKNSAGNFGVVFSTDSHEPDGLACMTIGVPAGTTDVCQYAADKLGKAVMDLKRVEENAVAALRDVDARIADINASIEVVR